MNNSYLSLLILAVSINFAQSQQTIEATRTHDGLERSYILYVPDIYNEDQAAPLLFNFHGYTSNATEQMFYGDFRSIADTAGFIIVHPQGTDDQIGNSHFNVGWGTSSVDDVGFTLDLMDALAIEYNIDVNRVYTTGMSNGGFMSYLLACQAGDRIAAMASITGSMSPSTYNDCSPSHPTPVLQFHGTNDAVVSYNGGVISQGIEDVIDYWNTWNQGDTQAMISQIDDLDRDDGSTVEHILYPSTLCGVTTELYKITGGGHTWPGNAIGGPGTNNDIDASAIAWDFLSRYSLEDLEDCVILSTNNDIAVSGVQVFPNPTADYITISCSRPLGLYELRSVTGQLFIRGHEPTSSFNMDMSDLPSQMYTLNFKSGVVKVVKL